MSLENFLQSFFFTFLGGGSKQKYISVPVTVNPQNWDLLTTRRGPNSAYWPTMTIYQLYPVKSPSPSGPPLNHSYTIDWFV